MLFGLLDGHMEFSRACGLERENKSHWLRMVFEVLCLNEIIQGMSVGRMSENYRWSSGHTDRKKRETDRRGG